MAYQFPKAITFKFALLALAWPVFGMGGLAVAQTSGVNGEFNSDQLDSSFSVYVPQSGPTFSLSANPGFLRMQLPASTSFDHWDRQDSAPQVRFHPPSTNWEITTRLQLVGPSGNQAYHAGLMIYFSRFDIFYWGLYRGQEVWLERSGTSAVLREISAARDLELKVTKHGINYFFSYRFFGSESWTLLGVQSTPNTPQFVGLIAARPEMSTLKPAPKVT